MEFNYFLTTNKHSEFAGSSETWRLEMTEGITFGEGKHKTNHSLEKTNNNPEFFLHVNLLARAG